VGGAWPAARQSAETTNGTWTADVETSWRGDDGRPRVQLQLRTEGRDSHWGFGVRPEDLQGLPPGARDGAVANARFHLVREAGTFTFSGTFDDGRGSGPFTFAPAAAYVRTMEGFGYRNLPGERLMRLAVLDVTGAFVRELRDAGQTTLPLEDLVRFRIHGVSGSLVRSFAQAGLTPLAPGDLVRLRVHGVTPDFLTGLRSRRYTGLGADDLTRMRIHGVTLERSTRWAQPACGASRRTIWWPHPRRQPGVRARHARARLHDRRCGRLRADAHPPGHGVTRARRPRRRARHRHRRRRRGVGHSRAALVARPAALTSRRYGAWHNDGGHEAFGTRLRAPAGGTRGRDAHVHAVEDAAGERH
jgi:hypothetical protein